MIGFDSRPGVHRRRVARRRRRRDAARSMNPSDGSELARIARGNAADIDAAVGAARAALDGAVGRD